MGSFLNQFIDEFHVGVADNKIEILNDLEVKVIFGIEEFCELFLNILGMEDLEEILKILQKYTQDEIRKNVSEIMHIFIFRDKIATNYQKTCLFNGFSGTL